MTRASGGMSVVIAPQAEPGRVGEPMTVDGVVHGRRTAPVELRWSWEDGERTWHAQALAPAGAGSYRLSWSGILHVPGIHRIDLRAVAGPAVGSATLVVVLGSAPPRLAISGQALRSRPGGPTRRIAIAAVVVDEGTATPGVAELRWLDGESDIRSREVSWVIDATDGWMHIGGTATGELGAVNQFRAHFQVGGAPAGGAERAEIRLYPPGANPGVDPPQRVIAGPVQGLRSRGSITT